LWYLSELLVGFGLFDAGVTIEEYTIDGCGTERE